MVFFLCFQSCILKMETYFFDSIVWLPFKFVGWDAKSVWDYPPKHIICKNCFLFYWQSESSHQMCFSVLSMYAKWIFYFHVCIFIFSQIRKFFHFIFCDFFYVFVGLNSSNFSHRGYVYSVNCVVWCVCVCVCVWLYFVWNVMYVHLFTVGLCVCCVCACAWDACKGGLH